MAASGEHEASSVNDPSNGLRILHVMRAPVGGLFRHVVDLSRAQARAGHSVGIIADSTTGGPEAQRILEENAPSLALGVARLPMHRLPHPNDFRVAWRVARLIESLGPNVLHGHGAKGGLYTRLPALLPGYPKPTRPIAHVYTPHGGSLHYDPASLTGRMFMLAERAMGSVTDFIPFESNFARRRYLESVGSPRALSTVVHNGLAETEFAPIATNPDAADFVFAGEMRVWKGVDTLIRAFASLEGKPRLALVGHGPDESAFRELSKDLGVADRVSFLERMSGREAFRHGHIFVSPSRAESLPYIVLEAAAARIPIIATNVGGVAEIFGARSDRLVPPEDAPALADAMRAMLEMTPQARAALADEMADFVHAGFTLDMMAEGVLRGYHDALAAAHSQPYSASARLQPGD